jgi:hypothetical protein
MARPRGCWRRLRRAAAAASEWAAGWRAARGPPTAAVGGAQAAVGLGAVVLGPPARRRSSARRPRRRPVRPAGPPCARQGWPARPWRFQGGLGLGRASASSVRRRRLRRAASSRRARPQVSSRLAGRGRPFADLAVSAPSGASRSLAGGRRRRRASGARSSPRHRPCRPRRSRLAASCSLANSASKRPIRSSSEARLGLERRRPASRRSRLRGPAGLLLQRRRSRRRSAQRLLGLAQARCAAASITARGRWPWAQLFDLRPRPRPAGLLLQRTAAGFAGAGREAVPAPEVALLRDHAGTGRVSLARRSPSARSTSAT